MQVSVLRASRDAFILSCAALVGLFGMLLFADDGIQAVSAIAGLPMGPASANSTQIAVGFDLVIPIGYGAGFILLAIGLINDDRSRNLALAIIAMTIVGMGLDFLENGMVLVDPDAGITGVPLSSAKYGVLAAMGFILTLLLTPDVFTTKLAILVFRYITPISLATNIMGLSGALTPWMLVPSLTITFLFAAWIAHSEAQRVT